MSFRAKFFLVVISASIALYAIVGGFLGTKAQQPIKDSGAQLRIFENVLNHIQNDYVDEPNLDKVRAGALRGLANGLDPYSSYLTPEQVRDYRAAKQTNRIGIGAELSNIDGYVYVVAPIKGSPAEAAGLKAGDYIEYIDGKATRDISLYDAQQLLLGDSGSKVKLRVLRAGTQPQTLEITRSPYKIPSVETRLEADKIGILKVYSLESGESEDIKNSLQNLIKQGAQGLILDLRGVAAGNIAEAVKVANFFIRDGEIAKRVGRGDKVIETFSADPSRFIFDGKMNVMMDLGTSGAAEIIASAIAERGRGAVVGERSFGAGSEQQLFNLRAGDGMLLTTVKWASSKGSTFISNDAAQRGVKPTVEVKRPDASQPLEPNEIEQISEPGGDANNPSQPEKVQPKPTPAAEDLILKKALELIRTNSGTAPAKG